MTREQKQQAKRDGDALAELIDGMIYDRGLTGISLADATGKSEANVSMIRNPLHGAQWTITDLPVLMRILDGKRLARAFAGMVGQVPVDLPKRGACAPHADAVSEIGQLLQAISDGIRDGELSVNEARRIKIEMEEAWGAVMEMVGDLAKENRR